MSDEFPSPAPSTLISPPRQPGSAAPVHRWRISPRIYDILLIYILLVGAFFRLVGIDWGEYQYLHPDERFLVWVGSDIQPVGKLQEELGPPPSAGTLSWRANFPEDFPDCAQWGGYFDASCSPLNPNNKNHGFYVYGTLPMFLARYIVEWVYGHSGFQEMTNVGRMLSALADWLAILLVYLVAARSYDRRVGLLAAGFSACSVLLIQQSHFFTMDTFANTFILLAIYFAVRVATERNPSGKSFLLLSTGFGVALGCAVASKLNAVPVAVMLPAAFSLALLKAPLEKRRQRIVQAFGFLVLAAVVSVLIFRIFQPYAFKGPGFFGLQPNPQWVANIKEQRNQAAGDVDFPPALQWARRPLWFSAQNLTVWGLGLPLGLLAWAGFVWMGWRIWKKEWQPHSLLWGWTALYFVWQSLQFNPTMRYQLPIYPTLAILAAWALVTLYDRGRRKATGGELNVDQAQSVTGEQLSQLRHPAFFRWTAIGIGVLVLLATTAYAYAFSRIYVRPITRVEASYWIFQNIPGPINLHIQGQDGLFNQILSFPYAAQVAEDQPFFTAFTAKASGTLSEVYLAHVLDAQAGQPTPLILTLSDQPTDEQPLATTSLEIPAAYNSLSAEDDYTVRIEPAVLVNKDQVYYLTLTVPEGSKSLDLCGPLTVNIQAVTEIISQTVPQPAQCVIRLGLPYAVSFTAQESGYLSEVALGLVIDLSAPSGEQTLKLTVGPTSEESLVSTAMLSADFSADKQGYTLTLDQPVELVEGQNYQLALALEAGLGAISLQGSGLANEGDWDDGLPLRMDGYDPYGGIYPRGLEFNMYWDDNPEKMERFLKIYEQADYIVISSNRQWGTLPRLPERFPMSSEHYRHLLGCPPQESIEWCYRVAQPGMFQGDLGFELVQVYQSDPSIGLLCLNDQFAEEAFTVYDHPKVLIFRKTGDYDLQYARQLLEAVDYDQIVHVTPKKAKFYPGNLMMPSERLAEQQSGGTWSELFNPQALHNRIQALGVVVWYLSVTMLGLMAYPLLRLALPGLPDKGYPLARTAGMLLLSYLVWLAGSTRIPATRLTISIVLALLGLLAAFLVYRQRGELRQEWSQRRKYFLLIEALSLAFFLFFLFIRWGNPDLWQQWNGGEKPMEFSYFNAVLKSTTFPPYDPWYAGGYLNYYYYGYVYVGMLVKWLGLVPSFAFNLIIPTLFSMVAMGAFSLGYNLVYQRRIEGEPAIRHLPVFTGLAAALGTAVLGNLGTLRMTVRGYQMVGVAGGLTDATSFLDRLLGTFTGLWKVLVGGMSLPYSLGNWYWIPSRAIPAPGEVEPITEFPMFTFLYADLHAHMIALPITLLALSWALAVLMGRGKWRSLGAGVTGFLLGGLAIGALRPTNTWDIFVYLALGILAILYTWWRYLEVGAGTFSGTLLEELPVLYKRLLLAVGGAVALVALALLLYLPYAQWYALGYNKIDLWKGTHTPSGSYLVHWGLFLFAIVTWMIWETRQWLANTPLSSLRKLGPYKGLIGGGLVLLVGWVILLLVMKVAIGWLVLPLAAWVAVLLLRPDQPDRKRGVLFMVGTGLVLTLVVEVSVLRGDIARMNWVFKFYLQVWTLFSACAAAAFSWLLAALPGWKPGWRASWQVALTFLVACAALFTFYGSLAKVKDRMTFYEQQQLTKGISAPHTLDGMQYMQYASYFEPGPNEMPGEDMDLSQDYEAIMWMQENVTGSPVIVEANSRNLYRWYSRFTIYTGLPGVLGWEWHQQQQRAVNPGEWVTKRVYDINEFYTTLDTETVSAFLRQYDVEYIILGQLERVAYPGPGLQKFEDFEGELWREVYRNQDTVIYQVIK